MMSRRKNIYFLTAAACIVLFISNNSVTFIQRKSITQKKSEDLETVKSEGNLITYRSFFNYIEHPKDPCRKKIYSPGKLWKFHKRIFDGRKAVCVDERIWNTNDCLVYSFGINNDWNFDDFMAKKYDCSVFAYDPSMPRSLVREKKIVFQAQGIADVDKNLPKVNCRNCRKVRNSYGRLSTLMERNNHTGKVIDYLKMDVEGAELEFFKDVFKSSPSILTNINQIGMEIHIKRMEDLATIDSEVTPRFKTFYGYFKKLEEMGFVLFESAENEVKIYYNAGLNKNISTCYEVAWIRMAAMINKEG